MRSLQIFIADSPQRFSKKADAGKMEAPESSYPTPPKAGNFKIFGSSNWKSILFYVKNKWYLESY